MKVTFMDGQSERVLAQNVASQEEGFKVISDFLRATINRIIFGLGTTKKKKLLNTTLVLGRSSSIFMTIN
mgnify:CR=1 FL=1